MPENHRIAIVIATRNRVASLKAILARLQGLPETPPVTILDNGSTDSTCATIRREYPGVTLIRLGENWGCAARNEGVRSVSTPYIAFSDDDSWWAAGALSRACELFDATPRLALLAARVLVGDEERLDPVCEAMAASPLSGNRDLPGPGVLGFLACGSMVRRSAYLEVGGFEPRFGIGGEEELLAIDLAAAGWELAYAAELIAYHHPDSVADRSGRRRVQIRNALWTAWLRRPASGLWHRTLQLSRPGLRDPEFRNGLVDAVRGLPWVLRSRRRIPPHVEEALRAIGH